MTEFYGMLTVNNIEKIAQMIFDKINGKTYTFVAVNDGFTFGNHVQTRVNQKLKGGNNPSVWYGENREYAGFNFSDSYGSWGSSTNAIEDRYDPNYENPYLVIEHKEIKITHRAPAGHLLHWQIVLQD